MLRLNHMNFILVNVYLLINFWNQEEYIIKKNSPNFCCPYFFVDLVGPALCRLQHAYTGRLLKNLINVCHLRSVRDTPRIQLYNKFRYPLEPNSDAAANQPTLQTTICQLSDGAMVNGDSPSTRTQSVTAPFAPQSVAGQTARQISRTHETTTPQHPPLRSHFCCIRHYQDNDLHTADGLPVRPISSPRQHMPPVLTITHGESAKSNQLMSDAKSVDRKLTQNDRRSHQLDNIAVLQSSSSMHESCQMLPFTRDRLLPTTVPCGFNTPTRDDRTVDLNGLVCQKPKQATISPEQDRMSIRDNSPD
jgi:hypothetical protein